jgi:DUF1680 family protein
VSELTDGGGPLDPRSSDRLVLPLAQVVLSGPVRVAATSADQLYHAGTAASNLQMETTIRAIPYYRWANRGPRAMRVWLPVES